MRNDRIWQDPFGGQAEFFVSDFKTHDFDNKLFEARIE